MTKKKTWSGDDGFTDTLGQGRVEKSSARMETLGTLDESSAALGLARVICHDSQTAVILENLQKILYRLMSEVAAASQNRDKFPGITPQDVAWIEAEVARLESITQIPKDFILPGATSFSAAMDLARTIIRRAERRLVESSINGDYINVEGLRFLNRLSTLAFYLEIQEINSSLLQGPPLAKEI